MAFRFIHPVVTLTFYITFMATVWCSDLYTLLMWYEVNLTPYRIKSVYKSLDQTVVEVESDRK